MSLKATVTPFLATFTAAAASPLQPTIPGYKYIGCVKAPSSSFPVPVSFFKAFSPQECLSACLDKADYVAIDSGCHCSTPSSSDPKDAGANTELLITSDAPEYEFVDDSLCDRPCERENGARGVCGGDGVYGLWETDPDSVPMPTPLINDPGSEDDCDAEKSAVDEIVKANLPRAQAEATSLSANPQTAWVTVMNCPPEVTDCPSRQQSPACPDFCMEPPDCPPGAPCAPLACSPGRCPPLCPAGCPPKCPPNMVCGSDMGFAQVPQTTTTTFTVAEPCTTATSSCPATCIAPPPPGAPACNSAPCPPVCPPGCPAMAAAVTPTPVKATKVASPALPPTPPMITPTFVPSGGNRWAIGGLGLTVMVVLMMI